MSADVVELPLEDESSQIQEAVQSEQVQAVLEDVRNDGTGLEREEAEAVYVEDGEHVAGIRVDLRYRLSPDTDSRYPVDDRENVVLDVFYYRSDAGATETTGYVTEEDQLLKEIRTDDTLMPGIRSTTCSGAVMLKDKPF